MQDATETMVIAQILGPAFLMVSFALFLNPQLLKEITKDVGKSLTSVFFLSFLRFLMGMIIISIHAVWDGWMETVVTVIGIVLIVGGGMGMLLPHIAKKMVKSVAQKKHTVRWFLLFAVLLGLILTIHGWLENVQTMIG